MSTYGNFIGGEWTSPDDTFPNRDPADTGDVVGRFALSSATDVETAVEAAEAAFPDWAAMSAPERGRILDRASRILADRKEGLAHTLTREEGKTLKEAAGEVQRAADIFRYYGALGRRRTGSTIASDSRDTFLYTRRDPLGVVALITPWNYPIAIPSWKMAPALVAGNTVVLKPASLAPAVALGLVRALTEAGLPAGVVNAVTGSGSTVGGALLAHDAVAGVSFTGSYATGRKIQEQAAGRLRTQLEMGGKNPIVVTGDADLDRAAALTAGGAFGVTGQACTATSRAIVDRSVLDGFTERLVQRAEEVRPGSGLEDGVTMGPQVSRDEMQSTLEYIAIGREAGAKVLTGGQQLTGGDYDDGYFVQPTVFASVDPDMRIAQEEIFGPVVGIIAVDGYDEAIAAANDVDYGLSASICTTRLDYAQRFARDIEAGVVKVNQTTTGVALQAPFGGQKQSSSETFKEQGEDALDFYSHKKTVYVDW